MRRSSQREIADLWKQAEQTVAKLHEERERESRSELIHGQTRMRGSTQQNSLSEEAGERLSGVCRQSKMAKQLTPAVFMQCSQNPTLACFSRWQGGWVEGAVREMQGSQALCRLELLQLHAPRPSHRGLD